MTNYAKGRSLEYRVKKLLEDSGFFVFRSPASKSAIDLVAFDKEKKFFIQCKKSSSKYVYAYGLGELVETARRFGAKPLLVYSFYYSHPFVKEVAKEDEKASSDEKNVALKDYLTGEFECCW